MQHFCPVLHGGHTLPPHPPNLDTSVSSPLITVSLHLPLLGEAVGKIVGLRVGNWVGYSVVGKVVGALVGTGVGAALGSGDGFADGAGVGRGDGAGVGKLVGRDVGPGVGRGDGAALGNGVGNPAARKKESRRKYFKRKIEMRGCVLALCTSRMLRRKF